MDEDVPTVTIEDLPDPIIEYILSYLSPYRDLKQCMQVNRTWYKYVYDVIRKKQRDFYSAVCCMTVDWCHLVEEPGPTISKRYSHSACCVANSMYIFGGCTTANTTFNDLWRLDLGTRCWIRPLAIGTYPPPKACATLVNHGDNLILFGGWTHNSPSPLHQGWRIFNHLHVYNIHTNRWTQILTVTCAPAMAGHSATMHGDLMVIFGGIQRQAPDGPCSSSNEIWVYDTKAFNWRKQTTTKIQPLPRYGHSQISIDKHHLLIIGGCGGPNMLFSDIWLLIIPDNPDNLWEWKEMEIRKRENAAPHLAFHPACKVGSQVVVLSKAQKCHTSPSSLPHLLRAPSRIWVPPRLGLPNIILVKERHQPVDVEPCVNGKRGVLKRHIERQDSNVASQRSSSDDDEFNSRDNVKKKSSCSTPETSRRHSSPSCSNNSLDSSPSTSGYQNGGSASGASASVDNTKEQSKAKPEMNNAPRPQNMSVKPNARRNRLRQLEGLDRMEQRLRDLRASAFNLMSISCKVNQEHRSSHLKLPTRNHMCLYVLDISTASREGYVSWRCIKNQSPSAPEEIILYSLVCGKGELIMFGGIQKDLNSRQQEGEAIPELVSNSLHFMSAHRFVI